MKPRSALFAPLCWLIITCVWLVTARGADTITVATYNVENYTLANRMVDGVYREAYPKPEAAKAALRQVIRALNADIIALQEMGSAPYLEELSRDLRRDGVDYPYSVILEAVDPDRHVALLSRVPLAAVHKHTELEFPYFDTRPKIRRGLLEIQIATASSELTLFVLHLKSRFTERPDDPDSAIWRAGEATAIRDCILKRFPDPAASSARFLIMGDCNDWHGSRPVRALSQRGKTTIAAVLPAADSRGESWTHFYRKQDSYSRVDHVLVSPVLKASIVGEIAQIYDGPGVREASDHRPVVVKIENSKPANK